MSNLANLYFKMFNCPVVGVALDKLIFAVSHPEFYRTVEDPEV